MFFNRNNPQLANRPQTSATSTRRGASSRNSSNVTNHRSQQSNASKHGFSTSRLPNAAFGSSSSGSSAIPQLKTRSMSQPNNSMGGSTSSLLSSFHSRPPTAPSRILNPGARGRSRFKFDDKTYISILKSDILRLQRKLDDLGGAESGSLSAHSTNSSHSSGSSSAMESSKPSSMSSSEEIEKFLQDFEFRAGCKTQNQMTKVSLMDVLLEKMLLVEKLILDRTCDDSENDFKKFDSNLSRIGLFFNLIEKTLKMYDKLTSVPMRSPSSKSHTPHKNGKSAQPLVAFEMPSFKVTTPPDRKHHKSKKDNQSSTSSSLTSGKYKDENKRLKKQIAELKRKCQRMKETERELNKQLKDLKSSHNEGLTEDYKNRIADLENTVKELQALNDKLQKKADKKSSSSKEKEKKNKSKIESLEAQVKDLQSSNNKLSSSSKQLQSRISSLESDLDKASKSKSPQPSDNKEEMKRLKESHAQQMGVLEKKLKDQNSASDATISKLRQQASDSKDSLSQLKKQCDSLKSELSQSKNAHEKESKKLKEQIADLEKQCSDLRRQLSQRKKDSAESSKNTVDADHLTRVERELEDLKQAHRAKIKSYEADAGKLNSQINSLESQLGQLQSANRDLKLTASADAREIKRLKDIEAKFEKLQQEMKNLARSQKDDEESLKRLVQMQDYLDKMEAEHKTLQMELEKQVKRNDVLKNCDALYQEAMQELRMERQKRKDLEEQSVSADRVRRLNEKVMDAEQVLREKNEIISKLEKKITSQKDTMMRMRKEIQRLLDDIESRDQRIEVLEETKKDYMRKLEQAQNAANSGISAGLSKGADLSQIMEHIKKADQSLNDVLVEELRTMRLSFQEKLKRATEEIDRIKKFHKKQLLEMQEVVSRERQTNDRQLQKLRDRCELLTKAVEAIKRKYSS